MDNVNNVDLGTIQSIVASPLLTAAMSRMRLQQQQTITETSPMINSDTTLNILTSVELTNPVLFCNTLISDNASEVEYNELVKTRTNKKHKDKVSLTEEDVARIKDYFYNTPSRFKETNMRNYAYFCLGINYGKRCGDIVNLRIGDLINEDGTPKKHIEIDKEQKTGKASKALFTPMAQQAVIAYLNLIPSCKLTDYIFSNYKTGEKISVQGMRKALQRMSVALDIPYNIGTHTLRRSWATHAYLNNPLDIHLIQTNLKHSKMETTEVYLKESEAIVDDMMLRNQW